MIRKRLYDLIIKAISIKGIVFGIATWLLVSDKIDAKLWGLFAATVVGFRAIEKAIKAFKGGE